MNNLLLGWILATFLVGTLALQIHNQALCASGEYALEQVCSQCPQGCYSCSSAQKCHSCAQGYQYSFSSSTCTPGQATSINTLTPQQLASYHHHLNRRRPPNHLRGWLSSVTNLRDVINSDPVLRMNWEYGISQCSKTLPNKTGDDVIDLVNTACRTPPTFINSPLVGFPINAIFAELMQTENGRAIFSSEKVNAALKDVFQDYSAMLQSPASLEFMNEEEPNGWFSKQARAAIDYSEFQCDPAKEHYGFNNWNQLFLRQFKPGMRPVGAGSPEGVNERNVIVNSCESSPLTLPVQPQRNVKLTDYFWLKDVAYSLSDMFAGKMMKREDLARHFEGGTVYQASLTSLFYHRWHAPVDGVIEDIYGIPGTYYLDQHQFAPDLYDDEDGSGSGEAFLVAVAVRKVIVIRANNSRIGKIALIYIGMAEVSSCVATVQVGDRVQKGQEIGHFQFGGSSHAIVFEKSANLRFNEHLYDQDEGKLTANKQNLNSFLAELVQ